MKLRSSATPGPVAIWLTVFVFAVTMLGTTIPTPLYSRYETRFGFGPLMVTVIFAAYAAGVLAALILAGRSSDQVGRRPVLLAGVSAAAVSSGMFTVIGAMQADGVALLLVARVISGLSAGIVTGTATAAIADFAGPRRQRTASVLAAVTTVSGLGLGPLIAGVLARHVGLPLQTSYLVHLGLLVLAIVAVVSLPESVAVSVGARPRIQKLVVPADARATFLRAGSAGFAGFAVLGLFTAVSPALLGLLGHHDPQLIGLVVFSVFAASALAQLGSAVISTRLGLLAGTALLAAGMVVFGLSVTLLSLPLLVLSAVVAGTGQGLSFRAALGSITASSAPRERAGVASSFFATCYVGISLPVIGVGAAGQVYGLVHAGQGFAVIIVVITLCALLGLARR